MFILIILSFFLVIYYLFLAIFILYSNPKSIINITSFLLVLDLFFWSLYNLLSYIMPTAETYSLDYRSFLWTWHIFFALSLLMAFSIVKKINSYIIFLSFLPSTIICIWHYSIVDTFEFFKSYAGSWIVTSKSDDVLNLCYIANYLITYTFITIILIGYINKCQLKREKYSVTIILITMLVSLISSMISDSILQMLNIHIPNLAIYFLGVFALGLGYSVIKFKYFDISAKTCGDLITSSINQIYFIVSYDGHINETNKYTLNLFDVDQKDMINASITEFLTKFQPIKIEYSFETEIKSAKDRKFSISVYPSIDQYNELYGFVILGYEITQNTDLINHINSITDENKKLKKELFYSNFVNKTASCINIVIDYDLNIKFIKDNFNYKLIYENKGYKNLSNIELFNSNIKKIKIIVNKIINNSQLSEYYDIEYLYSDLKKIPVLFYYYKLNDEIEIIIYNMDELLQNIFIAYSSSFMEKNISGRELEVLKLLLLSKTNKEISFELNINESSTKTYISRLYEKFDVLNREEFVSKVKNEMIKHTGSKFI